MIMSQQVKYGYPSQWYPQDLGGGLQNYSNKITLTYRESNNNDISYMEVEVVNFKGNKIPGMEKPFRIPIVQSTHLQFPNGVGGYVERELSMQQRVALILQGIEDWCLFKSDFGSNNDIVRPQFLIDENIQSRAIFS